MPSGGARSGAGRKKGSLTTRTREIAEKAMSSGKATPLDVMLRAMHEHYEAERWDQAAAAAKEAAPYMHPKLASVDVTGKVDSTVKLISGAMTPVEAAEAYASTLVTE